MGSANIYKNRKPVIFFLMPALVMMGLFLYYPFLQNILNGFMNLTSLGPAAKGFNEPV